MRKIFIIIIFFISFNLLSAQAQKKTFYNADIGYLIGVSSNSKINQDYNALRIRLTVNHSLDEKMAIGISFGTDNYREIGTKSFKSFYNTLPIDINGVYFLNEDRKGLFGNIALGYAPKIFDKFEKGLNLGVGIGYGFKIGKATNMNFKTGYNLQKINDAQYYNSVNSDLNLSSIAVTLGITF